MQVAFELSAELTDLPSDLGWAVILSLLGVLPLHTAGDMDRGQDRSHRSVTRLLKQAGLRAPYVITRASRIAVLLSSISRPRDIRNAAVSSSFSTLRTTCFTIKRYLGLPPQAALKQLTPGEIVVRLANAMRVSSSSTEIHDTMTPDWRPVLAPPIVPLPALVSRTPPQP